MQSTEILPLFSEHTLNLNSINISQNKKENHTLTHRITTIHSPYTSPIIDKALDTIFPEQQHEDKTIKRAKEILGDLGKKMTNDEIKTLVAEIQYLCETWLDKYERNIFKGMTLNEFLNQG